MEELLCGRYRGVIRDEMASTSISPLPLLAMLQLAELHCCSVATLHCALGTTVDHSACYSVTQLHSGPEWTPRCMLQRYSALSPQ